MTHRGLLLAAALLGVGFSAGVGARTGDASGDPAGAGSGAMTAAGTAIENRAILVYTDPVTGERIEVGSNVAQVTVAAVRRFAFEAPASATLPPGARADFPHALTNVGNAPDEYSFGIVGAPVAGVLPDGATLVHDLDGDGVAGPDEPVLAAGDGGAANATIRLVPGERASLVLSATVPGSAAPGARFAATILALPDPRLPGIVPAPATLMDVLVAGEGDAGAAVGEAGENAAENENEGAGEGDGRGSEGEPEGSSSPGLGAAVPDPALRFTGPAPALARDGVPPRHAASADHVDRDAYALDAGAAPGSPGTAAPYDAVRDGVYLEYAGPVDPAASRTGPDGARHVVAVVGSELSGAALEVLLREVAPGAHVYRSVSPFALELGGAAGGVGRCPADFDAGAGRAVAPLALAEGCALASGPGDALVASVDNGPGIRAPSDAAVTDPASTVFDAASGEPVEGARVTVLAGGAVATHPVGGAPLVYASDGAGRFVLPRLPAGRYSIDVEPPTGWRFPSAVPASELPERAVIDASYGGASFEAPGDAVPAPVVDVPLDPVAARPSTLVLDKRADAALVEVGDPVGYRISVENRGDEPVEGLTVIDGPPAGFSYVPGSARLDGLETADPEPGESGTGLHFKIGALGAGEHVEIAYRLQAGAGAARGDGVNLAIAGAVGPGGAVLASEVSRARVALDPRGRFSERGLLFGKVWIDATCDGLQNDAEWPLPGVRLYLEDGRFVVTDEHGQYSIEDVESGLHTVKLDRTTLPAGLSLVPLDTRHAADPGSRFARVSRGEMHRADFATTCPTGDVDALFRELERRAAALADDWTLDEAGRWDPDARGASGVGAATAGVDGDLARGWDDGRAPRGAADASTDASPDADPTRGPGDPGAPGGDGAGDGAGEGGPGGPGSPVPPDDALPAAGVTRRIAPMGDPKALAADITAAQAESGTFLWPADGISDDGRFMVVVRGGIEPTLYVDDVAVPGERIGERIENRREGAQIVAWYGVRLEPGRNRVEVRGVDPFGNARVLAGADVRRPAGAARLLLRAATDSLPADGGRSTLPIDLLLVDADGTPVSGASFVTLESGRGDFVGEDLRAREPGHQVRVENGRAKLVLKSSERAGRFRIDARTGDLAAGLNLVQLAAGRPLIVAGTIDAGATLALGETGDGTARTDDDVELDSRAALFLKGGVRGGGQLTLAYDTDATRDSALLGDPVAAERDAYPVTGDASLRGYEARSRSRLYARYERERSSLMWGDYLTDAYTELDDLARVQRTLTGANGVWDTGRTRVQAFAAEQSAARRGERFRGNGTAMLYELEGAPLVPNSEVVERIVTSRDNPGLEISATRLVPGLDYRLDPVTGRLSFAESVPSVDADLNPVSIRVGYDVDVGGDVDTHLVAGARIERAFGQRLVLGASVTDDADPLAGATLAGVQARALVGGAELAASLATMDHVDGREGAAARIGIERAWGEGAAGRTRLTWARADADFDNPAAGVAAGRTEWRLEHRQRLGVATRLLVEALESASDEGGERYRSASLVGERDLGRWSARVGTRRIDSEAAGETLALGTGIVGLERRFELADRPASLGVEHERAFDDAARQRSAVTARVGLHERVTAYGRWERERGLSARELLGLAANEEQLVAGVESDWLAHTELFSEYRMRGAFDGRALETASGVRGRYELRPGLSVSPAFEYVEALGGDAEDALALSVGVADTRGVRRRIAGQFELRDTDSARYFGVRASLAERLTRDWTALVREELTLNAPTGGTRSSRQRLTLGLARRPKLDHASHLLLLAEWKRDAGDELPGGLDERFVLSAHSNVRPSTRWTLATRAAGKLVRVDEGAGSGASRAALADARLSVDVARRWELDLRAGALATGVGADGFGAVDWAAGAGVAWLAERNLRLSLGWNVAGFDDRDLDADGLLRRGLRAGLEFKFDEELFRWLEP